MTTARADHTQALADLEAGRPLQALQAWRRMLRAERSTVEAHLQAASASLDADAIAPLRRQAIALAQALLSQEPGETEILQLGQLLRGWGQIALAEVPSRALQHLERAWSCGRDPWLDQQLAGLHARLGYGSGAHWLAPPPSSLEPWPLLPCPAHACSRCPQQPAPPDPALKLYQVEQGRIWVQRQRNPWHHSHGVAVVDQQGRYQADLCRHYPWPWPACPHQHQLQQVALHQLSAATPQLPPPQRVDGPVLAIAELSGEMFFHWQLELLPRLGRLWPQALRRWPNLRLWHNGGRAPYVEQGLAQLGINPERLLPASDHLQATILLVPAFSSAFGHPASANLAWLEQFWQLPSTPAAPREQSLWLGRGAAVRRPVLGEAPWQERCGAAPLTQGSVRQQLHQVSGAATLIAPHGAAMSNLLAAAPGSQLIELVNPAYQPTYFQGLIQRRRLQHQRFEAAPTPWPLQEWLYEGPMAFPIDLQPGASPAAEALASLAA